MTIFVSSLGGLFLSLQKAVSNTDLDNQLKFICRSSCMKILHRIQSINPQTHTNHNTQTQTCYFPKPLPQFGLQLNWGDDVYITNRLFKEVTNGSNHDRKWLLSHQCCPLNSTLKRKWSDRGSAALAAKRKKLLAHYYKYSKITGMTWH